MEHFFRKDTRIENIKNIINPFQKQLNNVAELCKDDSFDWWDNFYADDTEHLTGTVFIILQNYINSSISDLYPDLTKLHLKYSLDQKVLENSKTTRIELIITIANYYKHRDLPSELHKYTIKPLEDLNIEYKEIYDIENNKFFHKMGASSPVFNGFSLLSEKWNFNDLIKIVEEWRENLWNEEEKKV
jgi:hypothetical protein